MFLEGIRYLNQSEMVVLTTFLIVYKIISLIFICLWFLFLQLFSYWIELCMFDSQLTSSYANKYFFQSSLHRDVEDQQLIQIEKSKFLKLCR